MRIQENIKSSFIHSIHSRNISFKFLLLYYYYLNLNKYKITNKVKIIIIQNKCLSHENWDTIIPYNQSINIVSFIILPNSTMKHIFHLSIDSVNYLFHLKE